MVAKGLNNPRHHEEIFARTKDIVDRCAEFAIPNVIAFTGYKWLDPLDPASGEIIGGCCMGPAGGELIHQIIAAMHKRMTVQELAAMPHYHPTLAEIWTYPAEELAGRLLRG